jgi:hypothetical protein
MEELKEDMFGGSDAEQLNVLMQALKNAAKGEDNGSVYDFLEKTPKTSLIVELSNEITALGFTIKKMK